MVPETVREKIGDKMIKPSQIADLALYLSEDTANAITGESINIFGDTKYAVTM